MTYLASADLLAVRSLAAESAFSFDHRTDLPPKRSTPGNRTGVEGSRARIFHPGLHQGPSAQHTPAGATTTAEQHNPRTLALVPEPEQLSSAGAVDQHPARPCVVPTRTQLDAAAHLTPKGRRHRPEPDPAPEPEPTAEDTAFTVIDLRDHDTGWRIRTEPDHTRGQGAMAVVTEPDAYRTPPGPPPTTPAPAEAGHARRRSRRVRGYVRGLEPDEQAEFATLRNTIRAYLSRPRKRVA